MYNSKCEQLNKVGCPVIGSSSGSVFVCLISVDGTHNKLVLVLSSLCSPLPSGLIYCAAGLTSWCETGFLEGE